MLYKSKVLSDCDSLYTNMKLNKESSIKKSVLLLKIYRTVVWATQERTIQLRYESEKFAGLMLREALEYLVEFAPDMNKRAFLARISSLFTTQWLVDLIQSATQRVYDYPVEGKLYFELLHKRYLSVNEYVEVDIMGFLSLSKSTYYRKRHEAINVFTIALWGWAVPSTLEDLLKPVPTKNAVNKPQVSIFA